VTDDELFKFLGLEQEGIDPGKAKAYVAALPPQKRELFERCARDRPADAPDAPAARKIGAGVEV